MASTINGRQVNLLSALGAEAGMRGQALLEWIEFECGVPVAKLEDIPATSCNKIVQALKDAK